MSPRDQLAYAATGVRAQLAANADRVAARLGIGRDDLARIDFTALEAPDTAAAREAESVCDELPAAVRHHSYRSYLWAIALASRDGRSYDAEMAYCAALLHDAGLPAAAEQGDAQCFTLRCADVAAGVAERAGWSRARNERLQEAITLHLNAAVPEGPYGVEASLVNRGIALDVVGAYLWRIDPETVRAVLERHPRQDFKREIKAYLRANAACVPRGRVRFAFRYGGFGRLIDAAGFDE
jgi:hypothetical protein